MGCLFSSSDAKRNRDTSASDPDSTFSVEEDPIHTQAIREDATEIANAFELVVAPEHRLLQELRSAIYRVESPVEYQKFTFFSKTAVLESAFHPVKKRNSGFELEYINSSLGEEGVKAVSEVLKQNCNLCSLSIRNDGINAGGAEHIGQGLRGNSRLQSLSLSGNQLLGASGIRTLFKNMDHMSNCLLELDLSDVGMTDDGCTVIANFLLSGNACLRSINLSNNLLITQQGVENLSCVLSAYPRLEQLSYMNTQLLKQTTQVLEKQTKRIDKLLERNNAVMDIVDLLVDNVFMTSDQRLLDSAEDDMRPHFALQYSNQPIMLSEYDIKSQKLVSSGSSCIDSFGFVELRGNRKQMQDYILIKQGFRGIEDEHLFAVLDGHGGVQCVQFIRANFVTIFEEELLSSNDSVEDSLSNTFERLNEWCKRFRILHGTCAMVCYVKGRRVYSACAGDSQAILARKDENGIVSVEPLSELLTPRDKVERSRIESQGGFVSNVGRVCGVLAVSRAIGDIDIPCVSSKPTIRVKELDVNSDLQMIVIASDGVWGVHRLLDVAKITTVVSNPYYAASFLCDSAYNSGSNDNISIICVKLIT